jgi:hypothetical protein
VPARTRKPAGEATGGSLGELQRQQPIATGQARRFTRARLRDDLILAVAGRSLLDSGWPLAHGNPALVAAAGLLFAFAYGFKAFGWRELFRKSERPAPLALAAAAAAPRS